MERISKFRNLKTYHESKPRRGKRALLPFRTSTRNIQAGLKKSVDNSATRLWGFYALNGDKTYISVWKMLSSTQWNGINDNDNFGEIEERRPFLYFTGSWHNNWMSGVTKDQKEGPIEACYIYKEPDGNVNEPTVVFKSDRRFFYGHFLVVKPYPCDKMIAESKYKQNINNSICFSFCHVQ